MASSIFGASGQQSRKKSDPAQKLAMLKQFASGMTPQGAKRQVEKLLSSGKMTQEQFNQFGQEADEILKSLR